MADAKIDILIRAINETKGEIDNVKNQINSLSKESGTAMSGMKGSILGMAASFGLATTAVAAFQELFSKTIDIFKKGFQSVENLKLSAASMAAIITTFSKDLDDTNVTRIYKEAYDYSVDIVEKVEEWDAKFLGTAEELMLIVQTLAQGGVVLDANNKKQEEGLLAIANAIKIITAGQSFEIQGRQEVRALLDGSIKMNSRLAVLIDSAIGGGLEKTIKLWKDEGVLIENAGKLLQGFAEGSKDLEMTWTAITSTIQTIVTKILREVFTPIYEDIVKNVKVFSDSLIGDKERIGEIGSSISNVLLPAWITMKNIAVSIYNLLEAFGPVLKFAGGLVGKMLEGWVYIFAILPTITERVGFLLKSIWDVVSAIGNFAKALWQVASLDFSGAYKSVNAGIANWKAAGTNTGKAFGKGFLDEVDKALGELQKKQKQQEVKSNKLPTLKNFKGEDEESKKAADKAARLAEWWTQQRMTIEGEVSSLKVVYSDYEKTYIQFLTKIKKLQQEAEFKKIPGAKEYLNDQLKQFDAALYEKFYQQALKKAEERRQKEVIADAEAQQRMIETATKAEDEINEFRLSHFEMTEEEKTKIAIANEIKRLEAAQNTISTKMNLVDSEQEANKFAAEYLAIQDKIINLLKLQPKLIVDAKNKDVERIAELNKAINENQKGYLGAKKDFSGQYGTKEEARQAELDYLEAVRKGILLEKSAIQNNRDKITSNKDLSQSEKDKQLAALDWLEAEKNILLQSNELRQSEINSYDDYFKGIAEGFKDLVRKQDDAYTEMKGMTQEFSHNLKSAFSEAIYEGLTGGFNDNKKFEDIWKRFLDNLNRMVADWFSKQLTKTFEKGMSSLTEALFGGLESKSTQQTSGGLLNQAWAGIKSLFGRSATNETAGWDAFTGSFDEAYSTVLNSQEGFSDSYTVGISNMFSDVSSEIGSSNIPSAFDNLWSTVANSTQNWFKAIGETVSNWASQIWKYLASLYSAYQSWGSGGGSGGGDYGGEADVGYWHKGGYVNRMHKGGYALRYHPGGRIGRDEVPIVAQKGEYVLSRKDVEFVEKVKSAGPTININMGSGMTQKPTIIPMGVNVMIDNTSSAMLAANARTRQIREDQYIIDVVLKDINNRGQLGRLGR